MKRLKSTHEITCESTNSYTLITLLNYNTYQDKNDNANKQTNKQANKRLTNEQQTANKRVTTNNNTNKANNANNPNKNEENIVLGSYLEICAQGIEKFNSFASENNIPKVIESNEDREAAFAKAMNHKLFDLDELFEMAKSQPYLLGENKDNWKMSFDWLFIGEYWINVMESKYGIRRGKKKSSSREGY